MENTTLWYSLNAEEVMKKMRVGRDGLSATEATRRRKEYGANQLMLYKRSHIIWRFLKQFHHILVYVLLGAALIALGLHNWTDASVIFGVVIIDAIFGLVQEDKAERALNAIRNMLAPVATIVRSGEHQTIDARELVPGDVVYVRSGDKVPADLRLIESKTLQVQESVLTGESTPVEKNSAAVADNAILPERSSMLYSGTLVTYGRGMGVVTATGVHTEVGKIGVLLAHVQPVDTPLLRQMDHFGRWLTIWIVGMAAAIFLIGALVWQSASGAMFMAVIGLIVAAIPEGLPPLLTIVLSLGVTRMAKINAIVRHMPAIETMGTVTTICVDKTGTLTQNELSVQKIITARHDYMIEGGKDRRELFVASKIGQEAAVVNDYPDLDLAIHSAILCNDSLLRVDGSNDVYSDPLDRALLALHGVATVNAHFIRESYPRNDVIPYESEHKFMATLHHDHMGQHFIYVKGAPESILTMCQQQQVDGISEQLNVKYWQEKVEMLALQGLKVIAVAYKKIATSQDNLKFSDIDNQFSLVALFGLIDPPRPEVRHAIARCQQAGICVKMITGDHAATAVTISSLLGIGNAHGVLTGSAMDAMNDDELLQVSRDVDIYARVLPQHKLRLVKALQASGEIVAMTGDGVNDAPALRRADIGIAMGKRGTEIAKEAAEMVLSDDNFATIVAAIAEGRSIYDSLKKVILYVLPTSIAQAAVIALAILCDLTLPLTAAQILWVNMVTTVTLSLSLGFEEKKYDVMRNRPRSTKASILSPFLLWRTVCVTFLLALGVFALFLFEHLISQDLATTHTIVVNMIVMAEAAYLINCRDIYRNVINFKTLLHSQAMWLAIGIVVVLQLLFTYTPYMQKFFGTVNMNLQQWCYVGVFALGVFLLVELEKFIIRLSRKNVIP